MNQVEEVANIFSSEEMRKKEADFDKLALEIFSHYKLYEHVELIAPYVLVRILPKEMMFGDIIILEKSNKPTWEGIVLRTWEAVQPTSAYTQIDGNIYRRDPMFRMIQSELTPGDHVLFPHFAGQPVPGLDSDVYRLIPEGITKGGKWIFGNDVGVIFAKLDYQRESVLYVLTRVMHKALDRHELIVPVATLLGMLREEFDISVKVKGPRTLSGR